MLDGKLAAHKCARQVQSQQAFKVGYRDFVDRNGGRMPARVVDNTVELSPAVDGAADDRFHVCFTRHVAGNKCGFGASGNQFLLCLLAILFATGGNDNPGTIFAENLGTSEANPLGTTCDDGHFAC